MKRIAKFHKVSWEQFRKDWVDTFGEQPEEKIREIYEGIKLPKRATRGSAGYDFFCLGQLYTGAGRYGKDSYRCPGGDGRRLGAVPVSAKRSWLQVSPAVE